MARSAAANGNLRVAVEEETTPLLAAPAAESSDVIRSASNTKSKQTINGDPNDKPLPKLQIFLLCYARLVEPIAFFSIFPFVNQMVLENGKLPKSDVGFYSGLIESLFSLTQMSVMILWGRAADRLGRKPVLVSSLAGVAVATALFGLSTSIWQMILFRCLAGVFAGTIVTIRSMVTEHSTAKTQARAFSWFAFSGNLGIFLGPLIGGALAEPARQYPNVFGNVKFLEDYPYALPTFITGSIGASAALISALFVEETLVRKESSTAEDGSKGRPSLSTWEILRSPGVPIVLYLYGHVMMLAFAYTAVIPVFWFTPIKLGGYDFSPFKISIFMGLTGLAQAIWLLVIFPPLQNRFGTGGVMRGCATMYPFLFITPPLFNLLLRQGTAESKIIFRVVAPISLVLGVGVSMAYTAIQLALNDISPSPQTLGTLNAMALTLISGIRAFTPALFTTIFAEGVRNHILQGHLIWVVLIFVAGIFSIAVHWLPAKVEDGVRRNKDSDIAED